MSTPTPTPLLDFRVHLPTIIAAIGDRSMQAFQPVVNTVHCRYVSPCAIGVCLDPEERHRLDNEPFPALSALLRSRKIRVAPGQSEEWEKLQYLHDGYTVTRARSSHSVELLEDARMLFMNFVNHLKEKYLVVPA